MTQIQQILWRKFEQSKEANPSYSLRAFAKRLGVSSGALSLIMNGKRNVSFKLAKKISLILGLEQEESANLLGRAQESQYVQLEMEQFKVMSEWYHFAILNLIKLKTCQHKPLWMATRLNLPLDTVQKAIERLIKLGHLKVVRGKYQRQKPSLSTSDDISDLTLKRAHQENLRLAARQLDRVSTPHRDYTALTMAVDPKTLPLVKKQIRQFQDEIALIMEKQNATEVYKMCIQLFPLTELGEQYE